MTQIKPDAEAEDGRDPRTYAIIGAAMEVHKQLGHGFLEAVYAAALAIEFRLRGIPFKQEVSHKIAYKGQDLPCGYRSDFYCFDEVIVELKASGGLTNDDQAQLLNYLRATRQQTGLLLNFGRPRLEYKRMVFTPPDLPASV